MAQPSTRPTGETLYGFHDADEPADPLLDELGPHTTGRSCVYIKRLADIDDTVLEQLITGSGDASTTPGRSASTPAVDDDQSRQNSLPSGSAMTM